MIEKKITNSQANGKHKSQLMCTDQIQNIFQRIFFTKYMLTHHENLNELSGFFLEARSSQTCFWARYTRSQYHSSKKDSLANNTVL